jgi:hypothetical protein
MRVRFAAAAQRDSHCGRSHGARLFLRYLICGMSPLS